MTSAWLEAPRLASVFEWIAIVLALTMTGAVILERVGFAVQQVRQRRIEKRYAPLLRRALAGDEDALSDLVASPSRHRLAIAALLVLPLIADRDPRRIASTRAIMSAMSLIPLAVRYRQSRRWWRRGIGLRVLGLVQARDQTAAIIAALDDVNGEVRAAALDALADLQDPAALPAIVVRLNDASLHRGRRAAALAAFGSRCEPFLLELSRIDPTHRASYARALAICGTERSRSELCRWASDTRAEVRAAAFEGLAHVGLDAPSARCALDALDSSDALVRAAAAHALNGWTGLGAPARLARQLDDTWTVAASAAHSLQSMGEAGAAELRACASRSDLAGALARQMLWRETAQL
jgi:HEAT repeat protein